MTANAHALNLTLPSQFSVSDASLLEGRLREHLDVGQPRYILRKSIDPSAGEQFIQLIGDAAKWLPLSAAAAVFFSTIAKRAADALWMLPLRH
jgi:hypothetical protein